jgi:5'-nucleotidase
MSPHSFGPRRRSPCPTGLLPTCRSFVLLLSTMLAGCAVAPGTPAGAPPPPEEARLLRLQVLHTNDFHGRILPQELDGDTVGGSALEAAHFDSLRVRFPGPTLLLSGGDVMQGTAVSNLSWGRASIDVHNRKGYDAAALGNHEFDWGLDTLRARVSESRFPWLAANVVDEATGSWPEWIRPWVELERDGVRIGVVGAALATTPEVVMAGNTAGLLFLEEAPAIDLAVRELRALEVDFVIVVGHVGATCEVPGTEPEEISHGCEGRMVDIARALSEPVDLFLGGHTHLRNLTEAGGVPLVQVPAYSQGFSVTRLERTAGEAARVTHRSIRRPGREGVDPDTAVTRVVVEWSSEIRPLLERPVAVLAREFSNAERRPEENPAGNLLADAVRWANGADVGLINNGSLRRSLPGGELPFGILYEFQPFQNELVTVELTGAQLREALEFGLTEAGEPWIHVSGLRVRKVPGERRVEAVLTPDGRMISDEERLTVGTTEFLATGGDGFVLLTRGPMERKGWVDVDAVAAWLERLPSPVEPPRSERWTRAQVVPGEAGGGAPPTSPTHPFHGPTRQEGQAPSPPAPVAAPLPPPAPASPTPP